VTNHNVRIAFFNTKPYDIESFQQTNSHYGFEIHYFEENLSLDTVALTKDMDAVCLFVNNAVTGELIEPLQKNGVKLIALRCVGYNNVDLKSTFGKIPVVRVPAYSPYAVAEHAVALILTLNRKTHKAYMRTRENNFTIQGFLGFDLFEKTAGIVGTGKIGQIVIQILKGFGMKIKAYDPFPNYALAEKNGFVYSDLDNLCQESDIISLHCPLTHDTEYIINEPRISRMKPGVMLINTSRGKLVDTMALIQALKTGHVGSAGLDVYEEEEDIFFEDFSNAVMGDDVLARLLSFPNVLVTSHQAFFTKEALSNIAFATLENVRLFFQENKLPNEICYRCGQNPSQCPKKETGKCFLSKKPGDN
jgi:D-lactate dehydrogenase